MELSCKTEYTLLALLELTEHQQKPLQIRQIAAKQDIPDRYLEQLLATLRRGGLVKSQRGAKGGYLLARNPGQITLLDVISCLEGSETKVAKQGHVATVEKTIVQEVWREVYKSALEVLQSYTLQDLSDKRKAQTQSDFMYYI